MVVYFNDIRIEFIEESDFIADFDNVEYLKSDREIGIFVKRLHKGEYNSDINLIVSDVDQIVSGFINHYKYVKAAGGLVKNRNNEYLLIRRLGIWDLPKGKSEKNETNEETAIREVCEETGLNSIKITGELPDTWHIYYRKSSWYLKQTHWFSMITEETTPLIPQLDEDITDAFWMNASDASQSLSGSYRSIADTLNFINPEE